MTNYPYTRDTPAGGNNPSVDRPVMTQNFNSTDGIVAEDHYGFNVANGGFHKQARMPAGSLPTGRIPNSGTIYVKSLGNRQLFYVNDDTSNEYQMTRVSNTNFSTFSTNPGWTFLPGGLLLQYGESTSNTSSPNAEVTFPFPFTTVFTVQICVLENSNSRRIWHVNSLANDKFTAYIQNDSGTSVANTFYWHAIGK